MELIIFYKKIYDCSVNFLNIKIMVYVNNTVFIFIYLVILLSNLIYVIIINKKNK